MIFGIIGGGVVGQATKAYLESKGHEVIVWDPDPKKCSDGRSIVLTLSHVILCVPIPGKDGRLDTLILDAWGEEFRTLDLKCIVIIRSTIPLGYTQKFEEMSGCPTIYWPEFLTERTAEEDALKPLLDVLGHTNKSCRYAADLANAIDPNSMSYWLCMSEEVELIKLLSNTYGAVLVSLMNEFHGICEDNGVDWGTVRDGLLNTGRVLEVYSHVPGPDGKKGWGDKCWPKDADEVASMVNRETSVIKTAIIQNAFDVLSQMLKGLKK